MFRKKEEPQIILKMAFSVYHGESEDTLEPQDIAIGTQENIPVPEIIICANEAGFRYLSKFFRRNAREAKGLKKLPLSIAIQSHDHFYLQFEPFDYALSDMIEFRIVHFDNKSRDEVFKHLDISEKTARRDSLLKRAKDLTEIANAYIKRVYGN